MINQKSTEAPIIVRTPLGTCIENYVSDQRRKDVAKRATWLGNDETHCERRWPAMDLSNLKQLIDLTVHWIQMETLTHSTLASMPPRNIRSVRKTRICRSHKWRWRSRPERIAWAPNHVALSDRINNVAVLFGLPRRNWSSRQLQP